MLAHIIGHDVLFVVALVVGAVALAVASTAAAFQRRAGELVGFGAAAVVLGLAGLTLA